MLKCESVNFSFCKIIFKLRKLTNVFKLVMFPYNDIKCITYISNIESYHEQIFRKKS
jgi:hypothetical protein